VSVCGKTPGFVIAATGLRAEACMAEGVDRVRAVAGGGDGRRLEALIEHQVDAGGQAIISFGIAAGLARGIAAGTCLAGGTVIHDGAAYAADPAWTASIKAAIGTTDPITIAGVDRPLTSAAEKQALQAETGAVGADMESHIVARLAAQYGLPFAVLRVIADPAEREIPSAALAGMRSDGGVDVLAVLASLLRHPGQLPGLLRLAADTRHAMAALLRCRDLLGPGLRFGDLAEFLLDMP
jgi:adenosylhomocysteine nucleosidase